MDEGGVVKKRLALLLRRAADHIDPPRPVVFYPTTTATSNANPNITIRYR